MQKRHIHKKALELLFYLTIILIFIMPIVSLVRMSFKLDNGYGLANYIELLQNPRAIQAIKNTVFISVGAAVISLVIGTAMAILVAYTNLKRKRFMEILVLAPFVIPSYIITLSWSRFTMTEGFLNRSLRLLALPAIDIYTLPGIVFILGICNAPLVYLITVNMLRKIPRDMEWAAKVSGYDTRETMLKINLKLVSPALVSGGILAFLAALDNFSVPAFLGISSGIPVLSTYIYEKAISFGPNSFHMAAALSIILAVIALSGTVLQSKLLTKNMGLESIKEDYSIRIHLPPKIRIYTEWGCISILTFINIAPIIVMIASSFLKTYGAKFRVENLSLENFKFVFTNRGVLQSIGNSILLAFITCFVCILIGTAVAYLKVRRNTKSVMLLESGASLTYAIPGIVLSLSMIFYWTMVPNVYGTIKILLIAYVTRYLILQIKGSTTAILAVDPALEEAAGASGIGRLKKWRKILAPLLLKQTLSSSFLIFVSALTEVTLSSMLSAAGTKTIGLTIFNLQQAGNYNLSMAMSATTVALLFFGYLGFFLLEKWQAINAAEKKRAFGFLYKSRGHAKNIKNCERSSYEHFDQEYN
ncbi:MAG: iron ABC transporter permease [Anaerotignum sp.]|nr:iron ABC transporter permease [Anaerotignum sp.]